MKAPNYTDIDDEKPERETSAPIEVGGSHAVLIVVIVCAGIFLLVVAVLCLLLKVRRLKKQLQQQSHNQGVVYNADVAVGRPVQPEAGPDNVISGVPVGVEP